MENSRTVQMTPGQYYFYESSKFLFGSSIRLIALQQAIHAGARISEVTLRHVEFIKAMTFGTRPLALENDGHVSESFVNFGNKVLVHFNYRTFANETSLKLVSEAIPFAITSLIAWEVANYFFDKPSPFYRIFSLLPINVRFQTLGEVITAEGGLRKTITKWINRVCARGDYANGCSSAEELKKEMAVNFQKEKATLINHAIDEAEKVRKERKEKGNATDDRLTTGQRISLSAFNFLFGGSLRLVALQQTSQASLRVSEVALRILDIGKHLIFGERTVSLPENSILPEPVVGFTNTILKQYGYRSFSNIEALQLIKDSAPFAFTAIVLWEMANFLFGPPTPLYSLMNILPINVRKTTYQDLFQRHGGFPTPKSIYRQIMGTHSFMNDKRSSIEIQNDITKKYGREGSEAIFAAMHNNN